jgi:predicted Fe-Mo cluster-binding NifX family protein
METKIAIPTKNQHVDAHFGHCEYYTIFTIDAQKKIKAEEKFEAPKGCGCKSNVASILHNMEVTTLLAGNMGQGAVNKLQASGIRVIRGCSGNIYDVIANYSKGEINDSGLVCDHGHDHDHNHSHGHHHSCNH